MKETVDKEAKRWLLDKLTLQEQLQQDFEEMYNNIIGMPNNVMTHDILIDNIMIRLNQLKPQDDLQDFNIIDDKNVMTHDILIDNIMIRLNQLKSQDDLQDFNIIDDKNVITVQVQQILSPEIITININIGE